MCVCWRCVDRSLMGFIKAACVLVGGVVFVWMIQALDIGDVRDV